MTHPGPADDVAAHTALLRTPTAWSRTRIRGWVSGARVRGEQVVTVALPPRMRRDADTGDAPALDPVELHGAARPGDLVARALDAGHRGLGVLIWADGVIGGASAEVHTAVETVLDELCRDHPVSVLCLYDRAGVGGSAAHLDMAVGRHPDGLRETQAHLRRRGRTVRLDGEFDTGNVDVLHAALGDAVEAVDAAGAGPVRVDLGGVSFLSASAARTLGTATAGYRGRGGRVEVLGAGEHCGRVLRLVLPPSARGIDLAG